jgi:hypothetical protein
VPRKVHHVSRARDELTSSASNAKETMMTMQRMVNILAVLLGLAAGPVWAGTEGTSSTFYGQGAGASGSGSSGSNTLVGNSAGINNTGGDNTFLGYAAGLSSTVAFGNIFLGGYTGFANTTGYNNTFLGLYAGYSNQTGIGNVFLGMGAGESETGSNTLYIDNCVSGGGCVSPLIYGEFDNHLLRFNGVTHVAANGVAKSQMHFSLDNGDYGGFLTSVLPNNFFVSSGARYDSGNWIQRSADGNAVMAGSGGVGYRIFTHTGGTVGNTFNNPTLRLQIDYSGQFGINTAPVAGDEIHTSSGAHLTSGGVWTDASSREYKEHIEMLSTEEAQRTLAALNPVRYNYKANPSEKHVGFIAEDVPELVAREDRKSLSPMDIVAVLTKVLQGKSDEVDDLHASVRQLQAEVARLQAREQR